MADGDFIPTWSNNKASASYNLAEMRRRRSITAQLADMASKWSMILFYWNHIIEGRIWSFVTGVGKEKEEEEEESSEADGEIEVKEEQTEENPGGLAARGDEVNYMVRMLIQCNLCWFITELKIDKMQRIRNNAVCTFRVFMSRKRGDGKESQDFGKLLRQGQNQEDRRMLGEPSRYQRRNPK